MLHPKRTTRVAAQWFALYPLGNEDAAESATKKLKLRYYGKDRIESLLPKYRRRFAAVSSMCIDEPRHWSVTMGVVGPPHRGQFFGVPDEERDSKWWMGLNFQLSRIEDKGLVEEEASPMPTVEGVIKEGKSEYQRLIQDGLGSIF